MNCVIEKEIFWCSSPVFMLLCVFRCTPEVWASPVAAMTQSARQRRFAPEFEPIFYILPPLFNLSTHFPFLEKIPYCLLISMFISVPFSHSVMSDSCYPMNCSMPGLPVHHQLLEFIQTHVHWVSDAIQPSHPLSSPSLPTFNDSAFLSHWWRNAKEGRGDFCFQRLPWFKPQIKAVWALWAFNKWTDYKVQSRSKGVMCFSLYRRKADRPNLGTIARTSFCVGSSPPPSTQYPQLSNWRINRL